MNETDPEANLCIVASPLYIEHLTGPGHPERPARYTSIVTALSNTGLMTERNTLAPRPASRDEILLCHTADYYDLVQEEVLLATQLGITDGSIALSTGDAQISARSFDVASLAVGGVLVAVDAVCSGEANRAFCAARPPGHHATSDRGMGFCIFNNTAIGARYVQKKYGMKKVLIVDWDVHHGNGTQEIFYEDPSVFYFSTHRAPFYPGTGRADERGRGAGLGTTLNCPIKEGQQARENILRAFHTDLVAAMESFKPEFIFISAGFDAHRLDPLGGFNLTDDDFRILTEVVVALAKRFTGGRIVSVLEGGYSLEGLASATIEHVNELSKEGLK